MSLGLQSPGLWTPGLAPEEAASGGGGSVFNPVSGRGGGAAQPITVIDMHIGDFDASAVIYGKFTTFRPSTGAAYTLGGTPALSVYKDNSTTQSTTGVTLTADFDSVTGLNHFAIDTSADGTFYSAGSFFDIVITTGSVDSVSVVGSVVASFTLRKTSSLKPTTAGRTLDVSAGGEAGLDWANIGSPTTTVNLSGTTVKTATDVETDTVDIQSRLPAALVSGRMDASVGAMASNTLTAAALATDAVAEIQSGLSTLDAAGVRTAVGLASANLDTQLTAIDDYLDTEVAAIKAKTDNLPSDPADASDIAASFSTVNSTLSTIAGYIDTEVAAILAAVDTEVGAIKTVTDKLNDTIELTSDGYVFTVAALQQAPSGTGASATDIADEVQTRTIAAVTVVNGFANNTITAAALAADAGTELATAVWASGTRTLTAIDEDSTTLDFDATIRAAVGMASADLDTQLDAIAVDAAAADVRGERTVCRGTVTTGASTTSIPTSALTPAGAAADQFKGRIIIFDIDTTTAALRGQATDITASSNSSTPTFTVTALTSTPASGDTFTIV